MLVILLHSIFYVALSVFIMPVRFFGCCANNFMVLSCRKFFLNVWMDSVHAYECVTVRGCVMVSFDTTSCIVILSSLQKEVVF